MILWSVELELDRGAGAEDDITKAKAKAATAFCASLCALELIAECGEYLVDIGASAEKEGGSQSDVDVDVGTGTVEAFQEVRVDCTTAVETYKLSLHCGIASGVINCLCLGGAGGSSATAEDSGDRWEYLLSGNVLNDVGAATDGAVGGEVCLSPAANALVSTCFEASPVGGDEVTGVPPICYKLTGYMAPRQIPICPPGGSVREEQDIDVRQFSNAFDINNPLSTATAASLGSRAGSSEKDATGDDGTSGNISSISMSIPVSADACSGAVCLERELRLDLLVAEFHKGTTPQVSVPVCEDHHPSTSHGVLEYVNKRLSASGSSPQRALSRGFSNIVAALSPAKRGSASHTPSFCVNASPTLGTRPDTESTPNLPSAASRMFTIRRSSTATPAVDTVEASSVSGAVVEAFSVTGGKRRLTQMNNLVAESPPLAPSTPQPKSATDALSFKRRGTQINGDSALLGVDVAVYGVDSEGDAGSFLCDSPLGSPEGCACSISPAAPFADRRGSLGSALPRSCGGMNEEMALQPSAVRVLVVDLWKWHPATQDSTEGPAAGGATVTLQAAYKASRAIHAVIRHHGAKRRVRKSVLNVSRHFVHEAAVRAIENSGLPYIGEIRQIVTVFIGLENLQSDFDMGALARPQLALQCIIASAQRYGGSLRQFVVDDKGCVAILVFGTPGACHEDNVRRAIQCCLSLQQALTSDVEVSSRIGISQGVAYCGLVGSDARCEYAVMGACVNLAARIMCACPLGDVLVDEHVYRGQTEGLSPGSSGSDADTDAGARSAFLSIHCKGYAEPVKVFSVKPAAPTHARLHPAMSVETSPCASSSVTRCDESPATATAVSSSPTVQCSQKGEAEGFVKRCRHTGFIGREAELRLLSARPGASGHCSMLLVQGAVKTGKSALLWESVRQQHIRDPRVMQVVLQAGAHSTSASSLLKACLFQLVALKLLMLHDIDIELPLPQWLLALRVYTGKPSFAHEISTLTLSRQVWLLELASRSLVNLDELLCFLQCSVDSVPLGPDIDMTDTRSSSGLRSEKVVPSGTVQGRIRLSTRTEVVITSSTLTGGNSSTKSEVGVSMPQVCVVPAQDVVSTWQSVRGGNGSSRELSRFPACRLSSKSSRGLVPPGVSVLSRGCGGEQCCDSMCRCGTSKERRSGSGSSSVRRSTVSDIPMYTSAAVSFRTMVGGMAYPDSLAEVEEEAEADKGHSPSSGDATTRRPWSKLQGALRAAFNFRKVSAPLKRRGSTTDCNLASSLSLGQSSRTGAWARGELHGSTTEQSDAAARADRECLVRIFLCDALLIKHTEHIAPASTPQPLIDLLRTGRGSSEGLAIRSNFLAQVFAMLCRDASVSVLVDDVQLCEQQLMDVLVALKQNIQQQSLPATDTDHRGELLIVGFACALGGSIAAAPVVDGRLCARLTNMARLNGMYRDRVGYWQSECELGTDAGAGAGADTAAIFTLKPFTLADVSFSLGVALDKFNEHLRARCCRLLPVEGEDPSLAEFQPAPLSTPLTPVISINVRIVLANASTDTAGHRLSMNLGNGFGAAASTTTTTTTEHLTNCHALSKLILEKSAGIPSCVQFYCRWVYDQLEAQSDGHLSTLLAESAAKAADRHGHRRSAERDMLRTEWSTSVPLAAPAPPGIRGPDDVYTMTNTTLTGGTLTAEFVDVSLLPAPPNSVTTAAVVCIETPAPTSLLAPGGPAPFSPVITIDLAHFPRGPEDLLLGNFDKLSGKHQLIMKTASAIGPTFDIALLHKVLVFTAPTATAVMSFGAIQTSIRELEVLEWVVQLSGSTATATDSSSAGRRGSTVGVGGVLYAFFDEPSQDVVYRLMLCAQRTQIHSIVAAQLEAQYCSLLRQLCPTAAAPEFLQTEVVLAGKAQVILSKLLHHLELSRNTSKLRSYMAMALMAERWVFPVCLHAGLDGFAEKCGPGHPVADAGEDLDYPVRVDGVSAGLSGPLCEAELLAHCETLLDCALRQPYASFLGNGQTDGASTGAAGTSMQPGRLGAALIRVSQARRSSNDFSLSPAAGNAFFGWCGTWLSSIVLSIGIQWSTTGKPCKKVSTTELTDTSITRHFPRRTPHSRHSDTPPADIAAAIWWLQPPRPLDSSVDTASAPREERLGAVRAVLGKAFSCMLGGNVSTQGTQGTTLAPSDIVGDRSSLISKCTGPNVIVGMQRGTVSLDRSVPVAKSDSGCSGTCDVGYWVGELGLAALE